jgi:2-amino-4-hydroxy-6-hydroxymethyldihydropteridine diphosphokinase
MTSRSEAGSGAENRAFVALGANLGDAKAMVLRAIEELQQFSTEPIVASTLWETEPVNCPPGSDKFVNAVIAMVPRPAETPESLLTRLKKLERSFGRTPKKVLNEPRPIDLDLIAFGNELRATRKLTLPHPRAHLRRFVLQPLSELAPELILPRQKRTVAELLAALPPEPGMKRV